MPLRERLVPTHVGAEETILEIGALGLRASQGLHLLGGGVLAYQLWDALDGAPLPLRQALAGLCLLGGLLGAIWRPGGKPLGQWALVAISYRRFPRAAVWRVQPWPLAAEPEPAWVEVTPPLRWPTQGQHR